jgi:exopolyphosphatase/guanosine-5'-triphosphate,3'-diphosphate pyrophosphatase
MIKAAIDIGSNSFRLLVAEVADSIPRILEKELVTVRLAQGVSTTGCLSGDVIDRGLRALQGFRNILDRYPVQSLRACGTEALRTASNSDMFLGRASEIIGSPVEILDGRQEALVTLAGVQGFLKISGPFFLVDAGGGSTEFIYTAAGTAPADVSSLSIGLGVVTLTEKFLHDNLPGSPEVEALENYIREKLTVVLADLVPVGCEVPVVGSGGTITALAALDLGLTYYDEARVHGYHMTTEAIENLWRRLSKLSIAERNSIAGLQEGRGEIVLAGLKIYQVLLKMLKAEEIIVSDAGLLEGLIG